VGTDVHVPELIKEMVASIWSAVATEDFHAKAQRRKGSLISLRFSLRLCGFA
jgi:hypothetical protein